MAEWLNDNIRNTKIDTATISSGTTTSAAINLKGRTLVQLVMPSAFTGATITFQSSYDDVTYQDLYDTSGNQISVTVTTSANINIAPTDMVGVRYLKIVSASSEGADRTIDVISREAM